jgi:hypothetical protein
MDAPEQPPSKKPQRFFDIVPANQTKPSTSSRPIVVTNQPEQPDPMMKAKDAQAPTPTDKPKASPVSEPSQITVAEAMESASEPIKLDTPSEAEPSPAAAAPAEASSPPKGDDEKMLHDMPVDLPAQASPNVVVGHGGRVHVIRKVIAVVLILVLVVVIADLLMDLNIVKLSLPHSHYFGG